jgi:hypothetical protein
MQSHQRVYLKVVLGERRRAIATAQQVTRFEAKEQEPSVRENEETASRAEVIDPGPLKDSDHANHPLAVGEGVQSQLALGNRAGIPRLGAIRVDRELSEQSKDHDCPADNRVAHRGTHTASAALEPEFLSSHRW